MRVKGNVRIFGVPQSFLSHVYSEQSLLFFAKVQHLQASEQKAGQERTEEAKSKHIKSSPSAVSLHKSLKSDSLNLQNRRWEIDQDISDTQTHVAACTNLADNSCSWQSWANMLFGCQQLDWRCSRKQISVLISLAERVLEMETYLKHDDN